MVGTVKEVGPNRFRETFGRYYGDFEVGHIYEHRPGKTITEYDNHMFTLMTMNTHPMHFDAEFAKASEFKRYGSARTLYNFDVDNAGAY